MPMTREEKTRVDHTKRHGPRWWDHVQTWHECRGVDDERHAVSPSLDGRIHPEMPMSGNLPEFAELGLSRERCNWPNG
jgi:hypothetical protein